MSAEQKGIHLYTAATSNGRRVAVFLEELKTAYGLDYSFQTIRLAKGEQKQPWFIDINPNGCIPAIVDHTNEDFKVIESAAILLYLAGRYDKDRKFSFEVGSNVEESSGRRWHGER